MPVGSLVLPPPLSVCPPILLPYSVVVVRPALRVIILGGIIYMREDIGNISSNVTPTPVLDEIIALSGIDRDTEGDEDFL
ncbi:hypothetical protein Tco_1517447 [Tanacetum coccineum]